MTEVVRDHKGSFYTRSLAKKKLHRFFHLISIGVLDGVLTGLFSLFVLDFFLNVVDGDRALDLECNGLAKMEEQRLNSMKKTH